MASPLTVERVREVLDYNPETGCFTWRRGTDIKAWAGCPAGTKPITDGHHAIRIDKRSVLCSRLAWMHHYGELPPPRLVFKDGDRSNLRISNIIREKGAYSKFDQSTAEGRAAYQKAYRAARPEFHKDKDLKKFFGISYDDYEKMYNEQRGVCAICAKPESVVRQGKILSLAVDHDHATGAVRGLLCTACNKGLGQFCDSPDNLESAINYLRKHSHGTTVVEFPLSRIRNSNG